MTNCIAASIAARQLERAARLGSVALGPSLLLAACAPRSAITTWPWSDWYRMGGGGEMGSFEHQRKACLEQGDVTDPSAVSADSSAETDYIVCMNGSGWCTTAFGCQKPGAS